MGHTPPHIALFDSDTVFLGLMEELLAEEGYITHRGLVDGHTYQYVRQAQPDLVMLDFLIGNPQAAWDILELIRVDPTTVQIPILICSANTPLLRANAERLHQLRCATVQKPFDVDELLQPVAAMIPASTGDAGTTQ